MQRLRLLGVFCFVLSAAGASAAGYDEFAQGIAAVNRGDSDRGIVSLSAALTAADLNANLVPVAYFERARARIGREDYAAAVADLNAALKLKPDYLEAILLRGYAARLTGDEQTSVADYTRAIAVKPDANTYWGRGLSRWSAGDFAGAASDFEQVTSQRPDLPYPLLWHAISQMHEGNYDGRWTARKADALDLDQWPRPLFDLYADNSKPEDVFRSATSDDAGKAKSNHCEADFYVAEFWLFGKNPQAARPLLQDARATCAHDFVEYFAADVELDRLK